MRIGLVQMACSEGPSENLKKAALLIRRAAAKGARIICLQELFNTRYFCRTRDKRHFDLAQPIPGPVTAALAKLAKSLKVVLIAPHFEKESKGVYYNSAAVIDADGRLLGKYRKMHVPYDPGFYEKFYFSPGNLGFRVFKTRYGKIGVGICYDQWFPEAARAMALRGAEILFYPTAIGWKPDRLKETRSYREAWETVQRGHAISNGVFVAVPNRVKQEGWIRFWGGSFVAGPFGEVLARAGAEEQVLVVDCDPALARKTRKEWPFFRDRRADVYAGARH